MKEMPPPAAVTGSLLDSLMMADALLADAIQGQGVLAPASPWPEAARHWRRACQELLAEHLQGEVAEPLAGEQVTARLQETGLMPRALAEALAEIIGMVDTANRDARRAWAQAGQRDTALADELTAFRSLAEEAVTVLRADLRSVLTGFEIMVHGRPHMGEREGAAARLWEALGERP